MSINMHHAACMNGILPLLCSLVMI